MNNVKIINNQICNGEEHNHIFELKGHWKKRNKKTYILYNEEDGTKVNIKVDGEVVTMTRIGSTNCRFIFDKCNNCITKYNTPYGAIFLTIDTKNIHIKEKRIVLEYLIISTENEDVIQNKLTLEREL